MIYLLSQLPDRAADADTGGEAFTDGSRRLSYAELVARSHQLAHLLADAGTRRGDRVGIFLPRCLDTAVSVYGILGAGAAFVPIDPRMPAEGLRQLLRNCGIRHLVTHDSLISTVTSAAREEIPLECVVGPTSSIEGVRGRPWSELAEHEAGAPPRRRVLGDDLAYVMYSSGSTGRPKGIMHTHRSGLAYAELSVETYDVGPSDRIGNHSPLHFDMSTFGYFSGPYAGATTVVIPEAHTKVVASLSQLIESERLTIWYSVPLALVQILLRGVLDERDLGALRWVLFGGEPFPPAHLRALMERLPNARFSNVYGPAETNQCTYYHVPAVDDPRSEAAAGLPIPIGRLWRNTEGKVVDADDRPVSAGEVGELLVRSATMMRGYWARPDLDERCFHRDPAAEGPERVFYRTGDLVRAREDGQLLFLGRKDRQVKIRGYRVELDDVEHTLGTHPGVEESAVFPVREPDGTRRIEAVVTAAERAPAPTEDELRSFLAGILSWYAVPGSIAIVDSLPRTGTDKIDRNRLQALAEATEEAR